MNKAERILELERKFDSLNRKFKEKEIEFRKLNTKIADLEYKLQLIDNTVKRLFVASCEHENTELIVGDPYASTDRNITQRYFGHKKCNTCGKIIKVFISEQQFLQAIADETEEKLKLLTEKLTDIKPQKEKKPHEKNG